MKQPDEAIRELVAQWLDKAAADFSAAEHLAGHSNRFTAIVAFHCQQAAELAESLRDADALTPFGVEIRYPGDAPELLPDGEAEVVEMACMVRNTVTAALRQYPA